MGEGRGEKGTSCQPILDLEKTMESLDLRKTKLLTIRQKSQKGQCFLEITSVNNLVKTEVSGNSQPSCMCVVQPRSTYRSLINLAISQLVSCTCTITRTYHFQLE